MSINFTRGSHTLSVSSELFAENRRRLCAALKKSGVPSNSVIFLAGGKHKPSYNVDTHRETFRQESYFFWTFGVHESDFYGVIDVETGKSLLFAPKLHPDFAIWQGKIQPADFFTDRYKIDETILIESNSISNALQAMNAQTLLLLKAENTDSDLTLDAPTFPDIEKFKLDISLLYRIMAELRVIKTDYELEVMRYASKIGSDAHKMVMKWIRPGMFEYQLESLFRHASYYYGGARHVAYTCIGASGPNSAVLHYGHENAANDRQINDGDMCLFDMGPEYCCYASDITISFPVNGKFTPNQKLIYNAVLKANLTVFEAARPGIRWTDMHLLAEKVILTELKTGGLLQGEIKDMMVARLGAVFMPHGLGHLIGLETHDVGGYLGDALERPIEMGLCNLRTTRTLQERMVITIEPGCYFIDTLLDRAMADLNLNRFLVGDRIAEFRGSGGVRIEDDIVIWANGNENLSRLPRTVEGIESFMASSK